NYSPYNLPPESNPLAQGQVANVAYQQSSPQNAPAPAYAAPAYAQPAYAPQEPQRLPTGDANAPAEASRLVAQARLALDRGDLASAASLAEQAEALNVPDTAFPPGQTRPWQMSLEVSRAQVRREGVIPASATGQPAAEPRYPVVPSAMPASANEQGAA